MSSTPEAEWDRWFTECHKGTGKPAWEIDDDDTKEDEVEWDEYGT